MPQPFKEHSNNVVVKEKTSVSSEGCSKLPSCVKASLVGWKLTSRELLRRSGIQQSGGLLDESCWQEMDSHASGKKQDSLALLFVIILIMLFIFPLAFCQLVWR